jgi:rhodanese-related sulfurtransferase
MIAVLLAVALALQFGQRAPLTPAETLLESVVLRAINEAPGTDAPGAVATIAGSDPRAGTIAVTCRAGGCEAAALAVQKLRGLILAKGMAQPSRAIWIAGAQGGTPPSDTVATIHVAAGDAPVLRIVRGLWSTAGIGDEVAEVFARSIGSTDVRPFENLGQAQLDWRGVSTTTIVTSAGTGAQAAAVAASTAYFLATLPNAGAEALLAHLTVGAHARLADDGRRAVALMGNQQRASADVLIMFGQAIEREQRRMRSLERFMPAPVDPMLRIRLTEMEKGITSLWTSIGITSSPYVPPAERIRGRGGDDRRVPARVAGATGTADTAVLKLANHADVGYEIVTFIDGKRSISDIRDAVMAEFGSVALPAVVQYLEALAKAGAVTLK